MASDSRGRSLQREALVLFAVLAVTAAVYAPVLDHPFQYDSVIKIEGSRKLQDPLQYLRAFGRDGYSEDTSRFIPNLMLSLDRALFGRDPFGFHLTSLLVHLVNVCLVFLLGRAAWSRLRGGRSAAPLLGSAVFALHPLNSEAVNYSNALPNLMVTAFYLLALLVLLRVTEPSSSPAGARVAGWAAFWISVAGALFSKELAVTVVVMAPLLLLWAGGQRADLRRLLSGRRPALLGVLFLLGVCSLLLTGAHHEVHRVIFGAGEDLTGSWPLTLLLTVLGQAQILLVYLGMALAPWPGLLNVDHGRRLHLYRRLLSADGAGFDVHYPELVAPVLSLLVLAAIVAAVFRLRRRAPFLTFFCLWPFIAHAPTSLVPRGEPMVEYRTYLPMVGICLALGWALEGLLKAAAGRLTRLSPALLRVVAVLALAALLASGTALRNTAWETRLSLWQDAVQKAPRNSRAHTNLGKALARRGKTDEAERHYRRALELNPRYVQALNNLGNLLAGKGQDREAIALFRRALSVDPKCEEAHTNLGRVLAGAGEPDEAEQHYRRALQLKPDLAEAHVNLGAVLESRDRFEEAVAHYRRALQLKPGLAQAHTNLGNVLFRQGEYEAAFEHFHRAIELEPGLAEAHANLGRALAMLGRSGQAISSFRRALEIDPSRAGVRNNLGNALAALGRMPEAEAEFRRALQQQPGLADAHNNLGNVLSFQGRQDEALEQYRLALQHDPRLAEAENNLGRLLQLKGRVLEAVAHYRRATVLDPGSAEAHRNLGAALLDQVSVEEAIAHLRRALALKPGYEGARRDLHRAQEIKRSASP